MNNLPLQPLVWSETERFDTPFASNSALHDYQLQEVLKHKRYQVAYTPLDLSEPQKIATGFYTIHDAKEFAWNHYNEKMQPYVKPMPTWIDVDDRLPERKELLTDKDKCLVLTECGKVWTGFYNMHIKPDGWYLHGWTEKQGWHPFKIVAWMLASEFSTMQNLHKGDK